jgi:hypothetical protein
MQNLAGITIPTCEVLVKGQKRKLYGKKKNKVYLHNGDEFQLKLFNPLQERIGVQLKMNGQNVDNDILILSPGQDIIVERFIGTNKKLKFSTYEVDATNKAAVKAVEKNGKLEIIFYNEKLQPVYVPPYPYYTNIINWSGSTIFSSSGTAGYAGKKGISGSPGTDGVNEVNININNTTPTTTLNINTTADPTINVNTTNSDSNYVMHNGNGMGPIKCSSNKDYWFQTSTGGSSSIPYEEYLCENLDKSINYTNYIAENFKVTPKLETGRIEKGDKSNQHFIPTSFIVGEKFFEIKYKLLPFSLKPEKKKLYDSTTIKNVIEGRTVIKNESAVREYCKCNFRISRGKGQWSFCPKCGRKIK